MRRFLVWMAAGALVGAVAPAGLAAQGYGIYEHSSCMMGRAGTGTASPCADASAIFYNPAGIIGSGRGVLSAGLTYIGPKGNFTNDITGNKSEMNNLKFYIPHLYYARDLGGGYSAGLGVFAPYGLTTDWGNSFEGRFLGYKSKIQSIYVQPTFAARITSTIKVGGGFDFSFVTVNLRQRADLWSTTLVPGVTGGNLGFAKGTDFAALAKQFSDDKTEADAGGDIGWFARGQIDSVIKERELFALAPGAVSRQFSTTSRVEYYKVTEKDPSRALAEEQKTKIHDSAYAYWFDQNRRLHDLQKLVTGYEFGP